MRIITLMENTCIRNEMQAEHGLSVYVETEKHKLLLDSGQSDKTWENAKKLGIDLNAIDTLILSHGHYDHSGGILGFAEMNPKAKIYMQRSATKAYYHGERYIGIDPKIKDLGQVHLVDGDTRLDEELYLFTNITGRRLWPQGNLALSERTESGHVQDRFVHEQCLVIETAEGNLLLSGCAHNGILNILDRYHEIYGDEPKLVISGFHMMKRSEYSEEEKKNILDTAKELTKMSTVFYTGHCTGPVALELMKEVMGDQLHPIHAGEVIL